MSEQTVMDVSEDRVEVARARAGLLRVCEPPSAAVAVFVDRVGAVQAWRGVLSGRAPRAVLSLLRSVESPLQGRSLTVAVLLEVHDVSGTARVSKRPFINFGGPQGHGNSTRVRLRGHFQQLIYDAIPQ